MNKEKTTRRKPKLRFLILWLPNLNIATNSGFLWTGEAPCLFLDLSHDVRHKDSNMESFILIMLFLCILLWEQMSKKVCWSLFLFRQSGLCLLPERQTQVWGNGAPQAMFFKRSLLRWLKLAKDIPMSCSLLTEVTSQTTTLKHFL